MANPRLTHRLNAFYCRLRNRLVGDCPRDGGPEACPLRNECPAYGANHARQPNPTA